MPRPASVHPGNIDILVSFMPAYPAVAFSCCNQGGKPHGKQMHINAQLPQTLESKARADAGDNHLVYVNTDSFKLMD